MRNALPPEELARDERFVRNSFMARAADPRVAAMPAEKRARRAPLSPERADGPDAARALMHGIFTGEIQALEGAGRTCWDFPTGTGADEAPFELKLDMARQCWDEARHCEISVKLGDWMGTEIGEFAESVFLYEAACNPDPVLRLTGVNRALEGLAIDVFNTMREFGITSGDPVLEFCEDWMLADEVTHVKMGSDWLRRLTADDPDRRSRALEFQRVVDKLFSIGGARGEEEDSPIKLARRFRELAGFNTEEIDEIAALSSESRQELDAYQARAASKPAPEPIGSAGGRAGRDDMAVTVTPETFTMVLFDQAAIVDAVEQIASQVGLGDADIAVEVNEAIPLARATVESLDPIRLSIDGGSFEDPRHPRQLSEHAVIDTVGRLLLQAQDRLSPTFGEPPDDGDMPLPHRVSWDVYAVGRLQQLGYDSQRQRRLYGFRNRHGFTDAADAAFERLWTGSGLTWDEITALSDDALAVHA